MGKLVMMIARVMMMMRKRYREEVDTSMFGRMVWIDTSIVEIEVYSS